MEIKSFKFSKNNDIQNQWERIFDILDKTHDPEALMMMILINKCLEEVLGRRIETDDFFHEEQMLDALKLLEHWLDRKSYFLGKVH